MTSSSPPIPPTPTDTPPATPPLNPAPPVSNRRYPNPIPTPFRGAPRHGISPYRRGRRQRCRHQCGTAHPRTRPPATAVTVVVADAYPPNFSICGIPYFVSGEVTHWTNLAHRTAADLAATGMHVLTDTRATRINVDAHTLDVLGPDRTPPDQLAYDALIVAPAPSVPAHPSPDSADPTRSALSTACTFCTPWATPSPSWTHYSNAIRPLRSSSARLHRPGDGGSTHHARRCRHPDRSPARSAADRRPPELGALVHAELERHGVEVLTNTAVTAIKRTDNGALTVAAQYDGAPLTRTVDFVLVVVGVRPDTELATDAGAELGVKGAIAVDDTMRTNLTDVFFAAGDCVHTHHRMVGLTWLPPLGTTAHKQAASLVKNAIGGRARFAGSSALKSSRFFSTSSPPAPAYANTKPWRHNEVGSRSAPPPLPTTTRPTTPPEQHPSTSASPATTPPARCSAHNSSATAAPKYPNVSTPTPPPCSTT